MVQDAQRSADLSDAAFVGFTTGGDQAGVTGGFQETERTRGETQGSAFSVMEWLFLHLRISGPKRTGALVQLKQVQTSRAQACKRS